MKIYCNLNPKCGKSFDGDKIKTKREKISDDMYELVWYCPECGHRYHVMYLNHAAVLLSYKIGKARQRSDVRMVQKLTKRYNRMVHDLNPEKSKH